MADELFQPIDPTMIAVVDALVQRGVPRDEAQDLAREHQDEWGASATAADRYSWVLDAARSWMTAERDRVRGTNQTDAAHARDPESTRARADLLALAKAQGYYRGNDVSGATWTDREREAVREYQRRRGLTVTGIVDQATVNDLAEVDRFLANAGRPAPAAEEGAVEQGAEERRVGGTPGPGTRPSEAADGSLRSTTPNTSSGGSTGSTGANPGAVAAASTPNEDGYHTIPGGAEIWQVDGTTWYAVYKIPGTSTPLAWKIEGGDLQAVFGPDVTPTPTRTLTTADVNREGVLMFGTSRLLANQSEHPFDAFVANFAAEARVRPWLRDEEILALTTRALLEGRTVTDAELAGTNWWRTHTAAERSWIAEVNRDPATAQQKITDGREQVRRLLVRSGVEDPSELLVTWLGDRMTAGTWTQAYTFGQIAKIADPYSPGQIDEDLAPLLADLGPMNTLSENVGKVDTLLRQWAGPVIAAGWTKEQKESWAGRLRNDPTAEEELINVLRGNRQAMFGAYDPSLSYDSIAAPWRGVATTVWGQQMDETDPLFVSIVQKNDLAFAQAELRRVGMERGIGKVSKDALSALGSSDLAVSVRRDA